MSEEHTPIPMLELRCHECGEEENVLLAVGPDGRVSFRLPPGWGWMRVNVCPPLHGVELIEQPVCHPCVEGGPATRLQEQGSDCEQEPHMVGCRGRRAWRVWRPDPPMQNPAQISLVAQWLIRQPAVHPCWDYWSISLVHLRPVDGRPDPYLRFDGATHEIAIVALDPRVRPDARDFSTLHPLFPPDLVHQVALPDDGYAARLAEQLLYFVLRGAATLDSDYRSGLEQLIDREAARLRGES